MSNRVGDSLRNWIFGERFALSPDVLAQFPELAHAEWRSGGVMLRVGGWCLGKRSVAGITLWRTVCIARHAEPDAELLLHELAHVHQFESDPLFPLRYLWRSIRHGYANNPYETDARTFAARRLMSAHSTA